MKWSEILTKPTRILGLLLGVGLVVTSIFSPLSSYLGSYLSICNNKFFDLVVENIGWITIIASLKEMFWQITKKDLKKFVPLVIIFFVTIFVYTISRQQKDILIIPTIGAEGAVACKILVLIFALLYQFLYAKLSDKISMSKWLYLGVTPIIGYFVLFAFCLFGNADVVPSVDTIASWKQTYPLLVRLKILDLASVWPSVIYYILCEIWAVTVLIVIVWQILNRYIAKEERMRFVSAIMIVAQLSSLNTGLVAGGLCKLFSEPMIIAKFINGLILLLTILMFVANKYLFSNVALPVFEEKIKKKEGQKTGLWATMVNNPLYVLAALLTVYYGLTTAWVEQFWKDKVRILAEIKSQQLNISKSAAYGQLNGGYMTFQSRLAIIFALVVSNIAHRLPWLLSAILTPFTMLIGSLFIFGSRLFPSITSAIFPGIDLIQISFWGGFVALSLFKSFKYANFDRTKEDYISSKSVDDRKKIKDFEGLVGRVGKSGGALGLYLLVVSTGSNFSSDLVSWILFVLCAGISLLWILSDFLLDKDMKKSKIIGDSGNNGNSGDNESISKGGSGSSSKTQVKLKPGGRGKIKSSIRSSVASKSVKPLVARPKIKPVIKKSKSVKPLTKNVKPDVKINKPIKKIKKNSIEKKRVIIKTVKPVNKNSKSNNKKDKK